MRVVLHIGQQKAGSSAIQKTFATASTALRSHGVLYPLLDLGPRTALDRHPWDFAGTSGDRIVSNNHNLLGFAGDWGDRILAKLSSRYAPEKAFGAAAEAGQPKHAVIFRNYCAEIEREIKQLRPHTVVLSGEIMFRPLEGSELACWLRSLFDEVTVVAYIRRPSELFLASVLQALRAPSPAPSPAPARFRATLQSYRRCYGDSLTVVGYERSSLAEGDIVADFTARFLPGLSDLQIRSNNSINPTSSAEIMAAMEDIVAAAKEGAPPLTRLRMAMLERHLHEISATASLDTGKAILKDEFAAHLDNTSRELLWLREAFSIAFNDVDYDAIGKTPLPEMRQSLRVSDFCTVNEEIRDTLLALLAEKLESELMQQRVNLDQANDAALMQPTGS